MDWNPRRSTDTCQSVTARFCLARYRLRKTNGLDLAKWLQRSLPITHRLVFTSVDDEKLLFDAMGIGVHIYLQKTLSVSEMLPAGRGAGGGRSYLPGADLRLPL